MQTGKGFQKWRFHSDETFHQQSNTTLKETDPLI